MPTVLLQIAAVSKRGLTGRLLWGTKARCPHSSTSVPYCLLQGSGSYGAPVELRLHICQLGAFLCKSQGDGPPFFLTKLCTALTWLWTLPQVSVQFSKLSHRRKFLCISRERVQPFWGPREALRKRWGWCLHAEQLNSFLLLHEQCYAPQGWVTTPAIKSGNTSKLTLFVPGQFCLTD